MSDEQNLPLVVPSPSLLLAANLSGVIFNSDHDGGLEHRFGNLAGAIWPFGD